ncbi:MAG: hypothetical protein WC768_04125 [Patescibacteria group bacterium]|jgi:hypothetical protein
MKNFFLKHQVLLGWGVAFIPFYFLVTLGYSLFGYGVLSNQTTNFLINFGLLGIFLVYFLTWQSLKNFSWQKIDYKIVFGFSAIFILITVFLVPIVQTDLYHYFFEDVSWVVYHHNPFFTAPNDLPAEPLSVLSGWQFLGSQHGPVRALLMAPVVFLSQQNIVFGLFLYKLFFGFFIFGCNFLIYKILTALKTANFGLPFLLFSWNPLVIGETAANGGTDILLVFFLLLSVYFLVEKKFFWSAVALILSVLLKYITLILVPFFLVYVLVRQKTLKQKIICLIKNIFLMGLISVVCFLPFWGGLKTFASTLWVAQFFDVNSFPGFFSLLFFLINPALNIYSFKIIFEIAFLLVYFYLLFRFFKLKLPQPADLIHYYFLAMVWFLLLGKFWFYPKYLIWLLPLIFLDNKAYYPVGVFLSGLVVFSYAYIYLGLVAVSFVPPVLIFSFYYFFRDFEIKFFQS